ncbi:hypothetical protein QQ045_030531 [Rhodiola kirilowii]
MGTWIVVIVSFSFLVPLHIEARVHVHITNNLTVGSTMNVHCQSRDNDLGHHLLKLGEEISWSFSPNFWGSTLFWCEVEWEGSSSRVHFDAYNQNRDGARCNKKCLWSVTEDGILLGYDETHETWQIFHWSAIP